MTRDSNETVNNLNGVSKEGIN